MAKKAKTDTANTESSTEAATNTTIWQTAANQLKEFTGEGQIAAIHRAEEHLSKLIATNYKSALAGFSSLKQKYEKAVEDQGEIRTGLANSLKSLESSLLADEKEMKTLIDRIVGQASVEKKQTKDPREVLKTILKEFTGTTSVKLKTINQLYKARTGVPLPALPKLQAENLAPKEKQSLEYKPVWETEERKSKSSGTKYTVKKIDKDTNEPVQAKKDGKPLFTDTVSAIKTKDWLEFLG